MRENGKPRQGNFEVLRILAMVLIVAYHAFCNVGAYDMTADQLVSYKMTAPFSLNQFFGYLLGSWGLVGVGCFFLISANFLVRRNSFRTEKALRLAVHTSFWSTVMWLLAVWIRRANGANPLGLGALMHSVGSPILGGYWYVLAYLFLYILSPYLNACIRGLELKTYRRMLLILTIVMPVFGSFREGISISNLGLGVYYYLLWGYLRQVPGNFLERHAGLVLTLTAAAVVGIESAASILGIQGAVISRMLDRFSAFYVLAAVALFYLFKNADIRSSRGVNLISSATLGVYLLHENDYTKLFLWNRILGMDKAYETPIFPLHFLAAVIAVYLACTLLELLRRKLVETTGLSRLGKGSKLLAKWDSVVNCED